MLKLRFSKPFHKQYMDGKVSVCKYECQIVDNQTKDVVSEFTVTGTAKCSPNDTVNPDFGAKLADSRAKLNAYKIAANLVPSNVVEEWIEEINNKMEMMIFLDQMRYLKRKEISHIEEICIEE